MSDQKPASGKTEYVLMMENEALVSAFTAHAEANGWNTSRSTKSYFGAWENMLTLRRFIEFAETNGFIPKRPTPEQRWYEEYILDIEPELPAWNDLSEEQRAMIGDRYTEACREYQAFDPNDRATWSRLGGRISPESAPEADKDPASQDGDPAP